MSEQQSDYMQGFYRGRAEGVIVEQERIIKLLKELKQYWSEKTTFEYGIVDAINVDETIALIKGENK